MSESLRLTIWYDERGEGPGLIQLQGHAEFEFCGAELPQSSLK